MMKLLAMTIATLSFAALTPASANIDSRPVGAVKSVDTAAARTKGADVTFAQRRGRKCQENLGYGRTGSE
jgi:hypothetical protein